MLVWITLVFFATSVICDQFGDLSPHIRPTKYTILLNTDFSTWKYTGQEEISVDVLKDVTQLRLHSTPAVSIQYLGLYQNDKLLRRLEKGQVQNEAKDLLVWDEPLKKGQYVLRCSFSGMVSRKLTGYYRTGYKDDNGNYIKLAATHLSPDKARTVFPSFDEPQFRAQFVLTLVHPSTLTAISNMPVSDKVQLEGGVTKTKFAATPTMSTYLLAWVQHNFVSEQQTWEGVTLRHYVRPGHIDLAGEKIELVGKSLKYFNSFFNLPYPLPKLDSIGVPNYLVGGMENWGLITMAESIGMSSPESRYGASEISYRILLTHEVSHMWFGNLVTMTWWNDLWLKEGMASYLSYPAADAIYDDIDMTDQLHTLAWTKAMSSDMVITSHPVQMPIRTTKEITQVFDSITYKKGAMVLSMLRDLMGEEEFKAGMTDFLTTYQFSIAQYKDLMGSMTKQCGDRAAMVRAFMDRFILQKNYPLITVEELGPRKIRVTQSRYVRDSGMIVKNDSSPFDYTWYVPITILSNKFKMEKPIMLKGKSMEITLPEEYTWLKLNMGGGMMYVSTYSDSNLLMIFSELLNSARVDAEGIIEEKGSHQKPMLLKHRDRGHTLYDVFSAAQLNLVTYERAFTVAEYLRHEPHYLPWDLMRSHFVSIRGMIHEDLADCYRKFIIHLLAQQWKEVKEKRRGNLFDQLKFTAFFMYLYRIEGKRVETKTDEDELDDAIRNFQEASRVDRVDIVIMLNTSDTDQVKKIGNTLAKYPSTDVSQIIVFIHTYAKENPEAVWDVYKTNYKLYNDRYGLAQFSYAQALKAMISPQRNEAILDEIEAFFKKNSAGSGFLGYQNGLEAAKFAVMFRKTSEPSLKKFLSQRRYCKDVTL